MNRIEQNEKLREMIVDAADLWDGQESAKYGRRLDFILKECGIHDVSKFYSKENMDKMIGELRAKRDKRQEDNQE